LNGVLYQPRSPQSAYVNLKALKNVFKTAATSSTWAGMLVRTIPLALARPALKPHIMIIKIPIDTGNLKITMKHISLVQSFVHYPKGEIKDL
jgi:hypothetical protein